MNRRTFLTALGGANVISLAGDEGAVRAGERARVPWSEGTGPPHSKVPVNATDCHHHIYDSRFPVDVKSKLRPGDATVADYRLLQARLGTKHHVIVQPSTYGIDNRCVVDALRQFGRQTARGIAVVNTDVSNEELRELQAEGVCGIRFNLVQAGATTMEMIEPLSKRVAALGWHIQVNATPQEILAGMDIWKRVPVNVVLDHLGHVANAGDAAFGAICHLLQAGKCWVKLSGAYMDTSVGAPTYSDRGAVAAAYIKEAPERLIWGTDWPHPTVNEKPDDAMLFDLLGQWCRDEALKRRILVVNPARLYGFSAA